MSPRLIVAFGVLFAGACTSHEPPPEPKPVARDEPKPQPEPEPEPEPPAKIVAKATIASVQMIEDCPDPVEERSRGLFGWLGGADESVVKPDEPAASKEAAMQPPADEAPPSMGSAARAAVAPGESEDGSWSPPDMCTQSTMQIAFTGQGEEPGRVVIDRIDVIDPRSGKSLGRIDARRPQAWAADGTYRAWDEIIGAGTDTKASYSLSVPDWSAVERTLGRSSYGHMFVLEVELSIDGERQTVRSPEFPREEPHVIVT
jgi:hypothetical protein